MSVFDGVDRRILRALDKDARMPASSVAQHTRLARGTVQSRLDRMGEMGALREHSVRVPLDALGLPVRATVAIEVDALLFDETVTALRKLPQVIECVGISGRDDLLCIIAARDTEDVHAVSTAIQLCPGVRRSATSVILKEFIPYRVAQLMELPPAHQ